MFRRSQARFFITLVAAIASAFACQAAAQDDSARLRGQLVAQLSAVIAKYGAKAIPVHNAYEQAVKLVLIDPQTISLAGGQLRWQLQPRRKLTDDEQVAVLRGVESWLLATIDEPPSKATLSKCVL